MTGKPLSTFIFLVLTFCHSSIAKEEAVPVLIWNANQSQGGLPAVSALQSYSYENFVGNYLKEFKPNNILLFLQDALSIEDITSHTNELHHIKEFMENGHSLYLPNVKDAARLMHDLPTRGYNMVKLDHDAGLTLKEKDNNFVVVNLPSTITNPSRRRALQKADEVVDNVISKIGDQRDFTVIFTGKKPSIDKHSDQFVDRIRISRSLNELIEPDDKKYHYTNCTRLYLRQNLTIILYSELDNPKSFQIPEEKINSNTGDCQNTTTSLTATYVDVVIDGEVYDKLIVTFKFSMDKGSTWVIGNASVQTTKGPTSENYPLNLTNTMDLVPLGMSFACSEKFTFVGNSAFKSYTKMELVMERFQVQAFQTRYNIFDNSWDCVGFFTVPIWCGLLLTLLLVLILTYGMFMVSDIKTMDRFDDPKSQPINVTTAERE